MTVLIIGLLFYLNAGLVRDRAPISGPTVSVSCPACQTVMVFPAHLIGYTEQCRQCAEYFEITTGHLAHDEQRDFPMRTFSICPNDWSHKLSPADAIRAIQAAFPEASVSPERGQENASAVLQRLRSLNAPEFVQTVYVENASQAVMITLPSSGNGNIHEFMLMPNEGIQLRCSDARLALKLSTALGYSFEETG
jgi:hypothetical protein